MHKIKKDNGRNNTTWGLKKDSPAKSETGKRYLEFFNHLN